ncbi:PH domain-containing protein [Paenibacillus elgii]
MIEPQEQIDRKAIVVWRWSGFISSAVSALLAAVVFFLAHRFHWPGWIPVVLAAGVLAEIVLTVLVMPELRWKRWRYEVREDEIMLQQGVMFVKRTLIPMVRIQHVDTNQGPLLRAYGLSGITFSTAAGSHEIPALNNETAEALRVRIAELAKVSHEDL